MSNVMKPGVDDFFETYRAAFQAMNAPAIAAFFAYPLHITSDTGEISLTVVETKEDWIEQVKQLLAMYRAIDFSSARIFGLAETEFSPRLFHAIVHWGLYNRAGDLLYDFKVVYTLVRLQDHLRITAISHNEILKYQALLSRLKSERT